MIHFELSGKRRRKGIHFKTQNVPVKLKIQNLLFDKY